MMDVHDVTFVNSNEQCVVQIILKFLKRFGNSVLLIFGVDIGIVSVSFQIHDGINGNKNLLAILWNNDGCLFIKGIE